MADEPGHQALCDREQAFMARAIADKQQWVADQAREAVFLGLPKDAPWQDYADRLLAMRKA